MEEVILCPWRADAYQSALLGLALHKAPSDGQEQSVEMESGKLPPRAVNRSDK